MVCVFIIDGIPRNVMIHLLYIKEFRQETAKTVLEVQEIRCGLVVDLSVQKVSDFPMLFVYSGQN